MTRPAIAFSVASAMSPRSLVASGNTAMSGSGSSPARRRPCPGASNQSTFAAPAGMPRRNLPSESAWAVKTALSGSVLRPPELSEVTHPHQFTVAPGNAWPSRSTTRPETQPMVAFAAAPWITLTISACYGDSTVEVDGARRPPGPPPGAWVVATTCRRQPEAVAGTSRAPHCDRGEERVRVALAAASGGPHHQAEPLALRERVPQPVRAVARDGLGLHGLHRDLDLAVLPLARHRHFGAQLDGRGGRRAADAHLDLQHAAVGKRRGIDRVEREARLTEAAAAHDVEHRRARLLRRDLQLPRRGGLLRRRRRRRSDIRQR